MKGRPFPPLLMVDKEINGEEAAEWVKNLQHNVYFRLLTSTFALPFSTTLVCF